MFFFKSVEINAKIHQLYKNIITKLFMKCKKMQKKKKIKYVWEQ